MNLAMANPRSTLHALQPLGLGTPDVESLLSYFCRLAVSHSVSLLSLAQFVVDTQEHLLRSNFKWHERNLSGMGESAETWACTLSALTGVGYLDQLTLVKWRPVVAQKGLAAQSGRWCPDCFADDHASGRPRYFRLGWDVGVVGVCHKHHTPLIDTCSECGRKHARHKANYVMPGWCSHCGASLAARTVPTGADSDAISLEKLWIARQIGLLMTTHDERAIPVTLEPLLDAIRVIINRLDAGKSAHFARRIGLSKGALHYWLKENKVPTLDAGLRIAAHSNLELSKLLAGNLEDWEPPTLAKQLMLDLFTEGAEKREPPRMLDWDVIRTEMQRIVCQQKVISLAESARQLGVDERMLYLRANKESRTISARWRDCQKRERQMKQAVIRIQLEEACRAIVAEGYAINLRELEMRVPREILDSVESIFDVIREIKRTLKLD
ncbi:MULTISPECIES: TniQ family protein [Deefgea]|uniref:TetR family transcriptional regulator n=1 Tax=Deefgea chitinilytica TaxID=570276 RepID=A0ABS2CAB6_9NEIS|nr:MULTISPECIES: TniQ family protein [Deefgea]MBM5571091.1 TetR family transcriptional regulator [Deefgea chitinilytica]MBM9888321.1 TniQ family protein [Deefgea sp. CFH1-16]